MGEMQTATQRNTSTDFYYKNSGPQLPYLQNPQEPENYVYLRHKTYLTSKPLLDPLKRFLGPILRIDNSPDFSLILELPDIPGIRLSVVIPLYLKSCISLADYPVTYQGPVVIEVNYDIPYGQIPVSLGLQYHLTPGRDIGIHAVAKYVYDSSIELVGYGIEVLMAYIQGRDNRGKGGGVLDIGGFRDCATAGQQGYEEPKD